MNMRDDINIFATSLKRENFKSLDKHHMKGLYKILNYKT